MQPALSYFSFPSASSPLSLRAILIIPYFSGETPVPNALVYPTLYCTPSTAPLGLSSVSPRAPRYREHTFSSIPPGGKVAPEHEAWWSGGRSTLSQLPLFIRAVYWTRCLFFLRLWTMLDEECWWGRTSPSTPSTPSAAGVCVYQAYIRSIYMLGTLWKNPFPKMYILVNCWAAIFLLNFLFLYECGLCIETDVYFFTSPYNTEWGK